MPKENIICMVLLTGTKMKNTRTPSSRVPHPYHRQNKPYLQSEVFKDFPLLLKHVSWKSLKSFVDEYK